MRGGSLQPLSPNRKSCVNLLCQFASRWLAVERYQSIDDTMVQLFVPQTCGVMTFQSPVIAVSTITLEGDAKWGATSEFRLLCQEILSHYETGDRAESAQPASGSSTGLAQAVIDSGPIPDQLAAPADRTYTVRRAATAAKPAVALIQFSI